MAQTSHLSNIDSAERAVPATERARLIREYGFEGALFFLHATSRSAA